MLALYRKKQIDYLSGTVLLLLLKPLVRLAARIVRRDHTAPAQGDILFLKVHGGGSLVIAYPALLGLRRRYPDATFKILTTPAVTAFADLLGIFDEIIEVNDRNLLSFFRTSLRALFRSFRIDTCVDLEVYSRLTTVFAALTGARNRITYFVEDVAIRDRVATHLVFFNRAAGTYSCYDNVAGLLGAEVAEMGDARVELLNFLQPPARDDRVRRVCIGVGCSALAPERMLLKEEWSRVLLRSLPEVSPCEVIFLGTKEDAPIAEAIIAAIRTTLSGCEFRNLCGTLPLRSSVQHLAGASLYFGIDSGLLHIARLFGIRSISFWGPTSPETLLRPIPGLEEQVHWQRVLCSPCVHVAEVPPCRGNNLCMRAHFAAISEGELRTNVTYLP